MIDEKPISSLFFFSNPHLKPIINYWFPPVRYVTIHTTHNGLIYYPILLAPWSPVCERRWILRISLPQPIQTAKTFLWTPLTHVCEKTNQLTVIIWLTRARCICLTRPVWIAAVVWTSRNFTSISSPTIRAQARSVRSETNPSIGTVTRT